MSGAEMLQQAVHEQEVREQEEREQEAREQAARQQAARQQAARQQAARQQAARQQAARQQAARQQAARQQAARQQATPQQAAPQQAGGAQQAAPQQAPSAAEQSGTPCKLATDFEKLLQNSKTCDMVINVKKQRFNCHRCVLEARAPVLSAEVERDMKENNSPEVTIEDGNPTIFQEFLLYLYSGKINLNWKNVSELYELCVKYDAKELKDLCRKFMIRRLSVENFCDVYEIAELHKDKDLTVATGEFFLKNPKAIIESQRWLNLMQNKPTVCNKLVSTYVNKHQQKTGGIYIKICSI